MNRESGQATLELVTLLIGFIAVFLGLIFICSLADSDINILLDARNNAELRAAAENPTASAGAEFATSSNGVHDIYNDSTVMTFSPQDLPNYTAGNTISNFPSAFTDRSYSVPSSGSNIRDQHAKLEAWKNFNAVDSNVFRNDFASGLSMQNALEAAQLVSGTSDGKNQLSLINSSHQKPGTAQRLRNTFFTWFGVRVSDNALKNVPGNRVYMPVLN